MQFFYYLAIGLSVKVIAIAIGFRYYASLPVGYRMIFFQVIAALLFEVVGLTMTKHNIHNEGIFNFYILIEFMLVGLSGISFLESKRLRKVFLGFIATGIICWCGYLMLEGFSLFASRIFVVFSLINAVILMGVLWQENRSRDRLITRPAFVLAIAMLIYFCCNIPYFSLLHFLERSNPVIADGLFYINFSLNIIRYPLVGLSFYLFYRQHIILPRTQYERQ